MGFEGFSAGTLEFMRDLAEHNDRTWFAENRARYESDLLGPEREFVDAIGAAFETIDARVQAVPAIDKSIFRINRDTRFSHDKSPYKDYSDLFFWIGADRKSSPGYFMRIVSDAVWVGCGAHSLSPEQLARLRAAIVAPKSGSEFERILGELEVDGYEISEPSLARVPAGFAKDAPRAELLRLTVVHAIQAVSPPPAEFTSAAFVSWSVAHFERVKPLTDWLVEHVG